MAIQDYYTTPEAAKLLGVNPATIRIWIKDKKISTVQFFEGSRHMIPKSEIDALITKLGKAV